jgi:hypothetical protein
MDPIGPKGFGRVVGNERGEAVVELDPRPDSAVDFGSSETDPSLQTPLPFSVPTPIPVKRSSAPLRPAVRIHLFFRKALCVGALTVTDIAATFAASGLAMKVHRLLTPWLGFSEVPLYYWLEATLVMSAAVLLAFLIRGLYLRREPFWEHIRLAVTSILAALVILVVGLFILKATEVASRPFLVLSGVGLLFIVPSARMLMLTGLYRWGLWRQRTLVLGRKQGPQKSLK